MRRTCPYLLGALLIALICLGGGLHQLDQLLGPVDGVDRRPAAVASSPRDRPQLRR